MVVGSNGGRSVVGRFRKNNRPASLEFYFSYLLINEEKTIKA